ncbi:hypothetical protein MKX03_009506 [Papaver bracteatum]|nr:hypothetical protein MKX03_009506 [Papaver bracteatum]
MAKGKRQIKYIENTSSRQVTYSKRKKGILNKTRELSLLCGAQVCLIMFSKTGKLTEYISPSTTMREFFDSYEKKTDIDLSEYEVGNTWQKELRKQEKINNTLRKEIRQRTGQEDLSDFSYGELLILKEDLRQSLEIVRHRKAKREEKVSHLNALNAIPSQVTLQLLPSQPNPDDAAGGEYFSSNCAL